MLNIVVLMGRLCAEPELKRTQNGTSVCSFTLALDKYTNKEKTTLFVPCVAWRERAEFLVKYFSKGSLIAIEGSLQTRDYTDKTGAKRSAFDINVQSVYFTGERREAIHKTKDDFIEIDGDDGELPF